VLWHCWFGHMTGKNHRHYHCKALNSLLCADVPLRNYSLTHSLIINLFKSSTLFSHKSSSPFHLYWVAKNVTRSTNQLINRPKPVYIAPSLATELKEFCDVNVRVYLDMWNSSVSVYSVSQKSGPLIFLWYFYFWRTCITENYLGYCPNIFLHLHKFWSIYLNN